MGQIKGKPAFMSPEQAMGNAPDARSDLFSVGTVLYTLLTGKQPFPGPSDVGLLNQVATCDFASA